VIKSPNAFGALLAVGLSMSLVFQAFINMGVSTTFARYRTDPPNESALAYFRFIYQYFTWHYPERQQVY
jgi:hypothetical protein